MKKLLATITAIALAVAGSALVAAGYMAFKAALALPTMPALAFLWGAIWGVPIGLGIAYVWIRIAYPEDFR